MMSTDIGTRPPITSCSAGAAPLYGTCSMSMPASDSISAAPTWLVLPMPEEAYWMSFALALAAAMRSRRVLPAKPGPTTTRLGTLAITAIGVSSALVS